MSKKIGLIFLLMAHTMPAAVTYEVSPDNFYKNIISYCHARWISYKYDTPFVYRPFLNDTILNLARKHRKNDSKFEKVITLSQLPTAEELAKDRNTLYVVPYFPENKSHIDQFHFVVDWHEKGFLQLLQQEIKLIELIEHLQLPKNKHLIALHVAADTLEFPTVITKNELTSYEYYRRSIEKLAKSLLDKPLYVAVFCQSKKVEVFKERVVEELSLPNCEFHYYPLANETDESSIYDMFSLLSFDYIIGSATNCSILAQKLKPYAVSIQPAEYRQSTDVLKKINGELNPLICLYAEDSILYHGSYSDNYVLRWCFQYKCHYSYDFSRRFKTKSKGISFDPEHVRPGDIVFVRDICTYMKELHPKIKHPYIIVTAGESPETVKPEYLNFLESDTIIAWLSVHACGEKHPKFHAIPLGILQTSKFYWRRATVSQDFAKLRKLTKQDMIYVNFRLNTNKSIRKNVLHRFREKEFCYKAKRKPFKDYIAEMAQYKFTISPPGAGPDCYRVWEALLVGTIPIMLSSDLDFLYDDLPVLIVDNWDEVTREFLKESYTRLTQRKHNIEKLFMEYWWKKIDAIRDKFFTDNSIAPRT